MVSCFLYKVDSQIRMVVGFHIDDYQMVYYTIIMVVYFTDIIYNYSGEKLKMMQEKQIFSVNATMFQ